MLFIDSDDIKTLYRTIIFKSSGSKAKKRKPQIVESEQAYSTKTGAGTGEGLEYEASKYEYTKSDAINM